MITTAFYPGWINNKQAYEISEKSAEIIKFFLWNTPCKDTSSSSISLEKYGWRREIWKDSDLREYLLYCAGLRVNSTYKKVKHLDEMNQAVAEIKLNNHFHTQRDCNRIVFYNNGKLYSDFMAILFYIRCAIAHGRFERYVGGDSVIYAMEAISKKKNSSEYVVKARMILAEETMLVWKKVITEGPEAFRARTDSLYQGCKTEIEEFINNNRTSSRAQIIFNNSYGRKVATDCFSNLTNENYIAYDNQKKRWEVIYR